MRRVLVCGPRTWNSYGRIFWALAALKRDIGPFVVVHGGANGADKMAGRAAHALGLKEEVHIPDWRPHGVYDAGAGFKRNIIMLESGIYLVLAFGWGKGTRHTISNARERGMRLRHYHPALTKV